MDIVDRVFQANASGMAMHTSSILPEFTQKITLSESVSVSDVFRREMNEWLLDMFGSTRYVLFTKDKIFMHQKTLEWMRKKVVRRD